MLRGLPLLKLAGSQRYSKAIQGPSHLLRFAAPEDSPLSRPRTPLECPPPILYVFRRCINKENAYNMQGNDVMI
jgi:hypothetical protein